MTSKTNATRMKRKPRIVINAHIETIFSRFQAANPHPTTELEYTSVFELLIAVLLSAQATDISVNKASKGLFAAANTPKAMYELGINAIKQHIKTIGLFNNKAKNIIATCAILIEQYNQQVPDTRAALETLPGVGRKTANVILNTYFGQATMAVDTHIFRVANRLNIAPGQTPLAVELGLLANIPPQYLIHAHHWLILHGRYTCKARTPNCQACIIGELCPSSEKKPPIQ